MPIHQADTVVNRNGLILWDVDPSLGPMDGLRRVVDGSKQVVLNLAAAMVTSGYLWTAPEGLWRVGAVVTATTVVGGALAALQLVVCPQGVAPGGGTTQLSATMDLTITAPATRFGTLIAAPTTMARGDSLGYLMTGTLTGLVGVATVALWRIG